MTNTQYSNEFVNSDEQIQILNNYIYELAKVIPDISGGVIS